MKTINFSNKEFEYLELMFEFGCPFNDKGSQNLHNSISIKIKKERKQNDK